MAVSTTVTHRSCPARHAQSVAIIDRSLFHDIVIGNIEMLLQVVCIVLCIVNVDGSYVKANRVYVEVSTHHFIFVVEIYVSHD